MLDRGGAEESDAAAPRDHLQPGVRQLHVEQGDLSGGGRRQRPHPRGQTRRLRRQVRVGAGGVGGGARPGVAPAALVSALPCGDHGALTRGHQ